MENPGLDPLILSTAVAIGIGLLVGIERERSKGTGPEREIAGIRTFTVVSLLGLLAKVAAEPFAFVVLALAVTAVTVAAFLKPPGTDRGITTEAALLTTFVLGAVSFSHPAYSAGAAVVLTILLASRTRLHDIAKAKLSDDELHDGLLLLAAALVVLPLLPDRTLDPLQTINPRKLWLVVVLVMSVNAIAYVALRVLGGRSGLILAGLLAGFVSSISTHAAMGQRATAQPSLAVNAAAAASFSSLATAVLLFGILSAVHLPLALELIGVCIAAGLAAAAYGALLIWHQKPMEPAELALGKPLSLRAALTFGLVLTIVLVVSAVLARTLGPRGALASIAAAGFADTHSAAISAAFLREREVLNAQDAQVAVLLAFTTNAVVKVVAGWISGPRAYGWRVSVGVALSVGAAWIAWLLLR